MKRTRSLSHTSKIGGKNQPLKNENEKMMEIVEVEDDDKTI